MSSETLMSPDNSTNITVTIEDINRQKLITLIPVIVLFVLLMIIGIVGNCLVVYVFGWRMKPGTQNILIVSLALFDVLTNVLSIPHEITVSVFIAMYPSAISCKIFRFINTFCSAGSMFTLLVIAVDRFRKICRPLKPQMYANHVRLSMIPILISAVVISLPAFAVHGQRTIDTDVPGLYGMDCSTPDEIGKTIIPLIYNLLMFLCFFTITIALAVLYTFILRETNRHHRDRKLRARNNLPSSSNSSVERGQTPTNVSSSDTGFASGKNSMLDVSQESNLINEIKGQQEEPVVTSTRNKGFESDEIPATNQYYLQLSVNNLHTNSIPLQTNFTEKFTKNQKKNAKEKNKKQIYYKDKKATKKSNSPEKRTFKNKTTLIAFLVTLVFILSFLPHFILQVTKFSKLIVDYRLHGGGLVAYNLFLRSYFINSVSNPFIYGALNTKFSSEVMRLWRRLTCRI